jgi:hypothetical protein
MICRLARADSTEVTQQHLSQEWKGKAKNELMTSGRQAGGSHLRFNVYVTPGPWPHTTMPCDLYNIVQFISRFIWFRYHPSQPGWNFPLGLHSESQELNTIPGGLDSKHLWEETVPKLI